MTQDLFTETRIPCGNKPAIADALWEITRSQLASEGDPQLIDWGVDDVALKDGRGQIAAIVYSFKPGDPGVISKAADYYLLTNDCRVQHWKYVGP